MLVGIKNLHLIDPFAMASLDPFLSLPFASPPMNVEPTLSEFATTRTDWRETPYAYVLKVDLPGLGKENVKIEVGEGRVLQMNGEREKEEEGKEVKWHCLERSRGKFQRRYRPPEDAKEEEVRAVVADWVLAITVLKETMKKPRVRDVKISGSSRTPRLKGIKACFS